MIVETDTGNIYRPGKHIISCTPYQAHGNRHFGCTSDGDPLVACLVALNILIPGISLLSKSFKNLMDEADPELLERIVQGLNTIKKPGWLYPHKLRALRSGT